MKKLLLFVFAFAMLPLCSSAQEAANAFHDPAFKRGFNIVPSGSAADTLSGVLLVDSTATAVWNLRQYNSKFNIVNNEYENIGNRYFFRVPGNGNMLAKVLTVNPSKGALTLECNASAEYKGIRRSQQPWVYMTVDAPTDTLSLAKCNEARLAFQYRVVSYEDCMGFLANKGFHAATYRIALMLCNVNRESQSFGMRLRLGLVLFDNRYMGAPCEAKLVGNPSPLGEDFSYFPKSSLYMPAPLNAKLPKVHQVVDINVDLMPILKEALRTAESNDILSDTVAGDWEIVACDMGWEMTGTYNAALMVRNLQLNTK